MVDDLVNDAKERMTKSVEATRHEFQTVRTGRAAPQLLERIVVEYYGTPTPLNQLAGVQSPDPRSLLISPYDVNALKDIEKAILESDLGINPSNDGKVIRLSIPQLTEERRKELVKIVRGLAEEGKIAIRNIRRDVMADLHALEAEVGKDDIHRAEERVQKLTDDHVGQIDAALKQREADVMEV
ncbi:MAG: ribosome recycling factor [Thermoleophilia bacterium]|nr:ribosome recycling factor [Thermoleophilia bacterium]MBJ7334059.1 ribosome recycling factor [Thermoleophilia bacterium]